jgi:hypothetical protein
MTVNVHNPDQYMSALRTIIAGGRKRIGLLIGAGAPAGMTKQDGTRPLIPAVAGLTDHVLTAIKPKYEKQIDALKDELDHHDIETILSRVRTLGKVVGKGSLHDLDAKGFNDLGQAICDEIGKVVRVRLPAGRSAYTDLVNWISGATRDHPVEIFTTNYDLLIEEAFERARSPYFDGFIGGREPFFDPVSVATNDLPKRWARLWKIHGSLGWSANENGEVVRVGRDATTHLVFPEHLKYDQTQKAPYSALLDRLKAFLMTSDTLLLTIGFSFADAHISSRVSEGLAANPSASVFAFQFKSLAEEIPGCAIAGMRSNFSLYARDGAMINGIGAPWKLPLEMPSKDWAPIRESYWGKSDPSKPEHFLLGNIEDFAGFFASSRTAQSFPSAAKPADDDGDAAPAPQVIAAE